MRLFNIIDTTFENFDDTVRSYMSKTLDKLGITYSSSQIFGAIYNGIKGIMQNVMFYIEDAFTEQNIYTATRKKSFYSLAKLSGYEPYYGSAATGTLVITPFVTNAFVTKNSNKVFIKNHSAIMNISTGMTYTIMLPTNDYAFDLARPLMKHSLKIVQGIWAESHFTAIGHNYETFQVVINGLHDKQYVEVTVNGEKYEQAASLYDMTEDAKEFTVTAGFDGSFEVNFGNGVHGHRLVNGDTVIVSYIAHDGENGNIIQPGSQQMRLVSPLYTAAGTTINADEYLYMSIDEPVTGGTNSDSIELIKNMIGYDSRSLVIATDKNLEQFIKRFSFIGRVSTYSDPTSLTIYASCLKNVSGKIKNNKAEYLDIDENDLLLDDKEKDMISRSLSNSGKAIAGMKFDFIDPVIRKYSGICYVKVKESSAKETTQNIIKETIGNYMMSLPSNTTFIPKSDIINICTAADDNIVSFDISFISDTAEQAFYKGYWTKYEKRLVNGDYKYVPVKMMYEPNKYPGIDAYGNISVDSDIEMPLIHGEFSYWPDKSKKDSSIIAEALQILFI